MARSGTAPMDRLKDVPKNLVISQFSRRRSAGFVSCVPSFDSSLDGLHDLRELKGCAGGGFPPVAAEAMRAAFRGRVRTSAEGAILACGVAAVADWTRLRGSVPAFAGFPEEPDVFLFHKNLWPGDAPGPPNDLSARHKEAARHGPIPASRRSCTIGVRAGPDRRTGLPDPLRLCAHRSSPSPGRAEPVPPTGTFGWDPFRPSPACAATSGVDSRGRWKRWLCRRLHAGTRNLERENKGVTATGPTWNPRHLGARASRGSWSSMSTRCRMARTVWPTIGLVIALGGCGSENSASSMAALSQIDLPPGVAVRELQVRRARTIDLGRDSDGFVNAITEVARSDSLLFVLDGMARTITAYQESNGAFVHSFGGQGRGPGEFGDPMALAVFDDTVYVVDPTLGRRVSVFRHDGTFIELRDLQVAGTPTDIIADAEGLA